ncbi:MAG: hypothetical protein ACR2NP_21700 [Pirellulaceae bacterium]
MSVTRRDALNIGAKSLVSAAFLNYVAKTGCGSVHVDDSLENWKRRLREASSALGDGDISALQWQEEMDRIYGDTPINDLLAMVRFDDLKESMLRQDLRGRGELFLDIEIPGVADAAGRPEPDRVLISKLAYVQKGRHIPPHGHGNMTSAFLCVSGEFDVQLFDRLEEKDEHMVVRKTLDQKDAARGTWSSISDYRNNVHWLTAKSDNCFLFTCKLIRLEEHRDFRGRINIDMRDPERLGSDTWRARKISFRESSEIY